ncbi:MAG: MerR family transcriptional regulator [Candidatus Methylomirabilia bacterium]
MTQFIAILREQLPQVAPTQTKYRVTEIPSERTIRFYTAKGLVDKPVSREGTPARYGYRHLLQILAIKYLQSQYLPLVKIRSLVDNISNRDLELLIPDIAPVTATHRGIARADRLVGENSLPPQAFIFNARQPTPSTAPVDDRSGDVRPPPDTWRRVEVGPGIELHVHAAALSETAVERLRGMLLRELGVLRGWFPDQNK